MVIFINDYNDDDNVCKNHFYRPTIQDDRIIVGPLIRNALRCTDSIANRSLYHFIYIFYTTNVYHKYFTRQEWLSMDYTLSDIICDLTVLFAFHSRKGYTIRYEVIWAIGINIIMVIEMSPSERR